MGLIVLDKLLVGKPNSSSKQKTRTFLLTLVLLIGTLLICGIIMGSIDRYLVEKNNFHFLERVKKIQGDRAFSRDFIINIIRLLILAPVLEELTFRLPLIPKKKNILIALSVACFIYVGGYMLDLSLYKLDTWIKIISIVILLILGNNLFDHFSIENYLKRHITKVFYLSAFTFALLHIPSFIEKLSVNYLYLAAFLVIPQFCLGICSGYLRIKNGIAWSIALHFLFNLPFTMFYVFNS